MSAHLETVLRRTLDAAAGDLPVPSDPWTAFAHRERAHRRTRRIRTGVVAAVLVAAVGIQTNVVPVPGWTPGIAIAAPNTELADSPLRGSLAGDAAWLAGMRHRYGSSSEDEGVWKVRREQVRFLYAADVGGRRIALALVPMVLGIITDWSLVWAVGPAGARPEQMREAGPDSSGRSVTTFAQGDDRAPGVAVVVGPVGFTVSISTGFAYSAKGRVERTLPVVSAPGSGVGFAPLRPAAPPPGLTATVVRDGRTLFDGALSMGWGGSGEPTEPGDATLDAVPPGGTVDLATLARWISHVLSDARLPAAGTTVRVRWTGTVNGAPAAVITARRPGSGVLAYAVHGGAQSWRTDLRLLLPAAGADARPLAWRLRSDGRDDRTGRIMVVAPPGAGRVDLVAQGAPPVAVPVDATGPGSAALAPDAAASVVAYARDGSRLAATPVTPFETGSGGLPGATASTRVVP